MVVFFVEMYRKPLDSRPCFAPRKKYFAPIQKPLLFRVNFSSNLFTILSYNISVCGSNGRPLKPNEKSDFVHFFVDEAEIYM